MQLLLALPRGWLYGRRVRMRGRRRWQSLPRSCFLLLVSRLAYAAPSAEAPELELSIEKEELAASCPEQAWFREHVRSHAGEVGQAGTFTVRLGKRGDQWEASITRTDVEAAERVLRDRSPSCQPLAEAVAITLAILADDVATHAEPTPAPPPPAPLPVPKTEPTPAAPEKDRHLLWVGAGGGAALSWISPLAPVLGFALGLETPHTRHGVRLMLTTEQKFELVPGRVVVQAWLGSAFSCVQHSFRHLGAAVCAAFDASMLRASAEGFDDGRPSSRSYEALGLEAQPSWYISDSYRLSAVVGMLVPFSRESFSVVNRGVAYVPPSLNWRVLVFSEIGTF